MAAAKAGKISGLNPADIKNCCTSFGEEFSGIKIYSPSFALDYSSVINNYGGSFNAPNYPNLWAFAALKEDGSIVAWGNSSYGGSGAPTGTGFTIINTVVVSKSVALLLKNNCIEYMCIIRYNYFFLESWRFIMFRKVLLLISIFSIIGLVSASPTKEELKNIKKIVGYFPDWAVYGGHRNYFPEHIPFDKLTHINVAFLAIVDPESSDSDRVVIETKDEPTFILKPADAYPELQMAFGERWNSPYKGIYGQLKKFKLDYPNISVLASIGGWTLSASFHHVAANQAGRDRLADLSVEFIREHNLDGVDFDWEYPSSVRAPDKIDSIRDTGTPYATKEDKENFTLMLKTLRTALDKAGLADGRYYQLTAAVAASTKNMAGTDLDKNTGYPQYLDLINVMTYDFHGAFEDKTNHQAPIYKHPQLDDGKGLTVEEVLNEFVKAGVPKYKLIVGSPFYTRGWAGVKDDGGIKNKDGTPLPGLGGSATSGAKGAYDGGRKAGQNPYYLVVNELIANGEFKIYRDQYSQVPYLYSATKKEFYTYEDDVSAKVRAEFVKKNEYGGIIIWDLSTDLNKPEDGNKALAKSTASAVDSDSTKKLIDVIFETFHTDNKGPTFANTDFKTPEEITEEKKKITSINKQYNQQLQGTNRKKTTEGDTGSAAVPTNIGALAFYDPEHGPKWNKHYEAGDKVLLNSGENSGKVAQAKWWSNKKSK